MTLPYTTEEYRMAMGREGPLAYQWKDKPHRLIYDLCNEVERLQNEVKGLNSLVVLTSQEQVDQSDIFRNFVDSKTCTTAGDSIEELKTTIEELNVAIDDLENQIYDLEEQV